MKELYKFKVNNGEKDFDFVFMEPSKAASREGDLVYAKVYADCVRQGLLTNAEAAKLTNERGGVFTEQEKDEYIKILGDFLNKEKSLQEEKLKTDNAVLVGDLEKEVASLREKVLYYQGKQDAVFQLTAETKARDATLLHYAMALTFFEGKNFFEGKDYPTRFKALDERSDDFKERVLARAIWYSTALSYGIKNLDEAKHPEDIQEKASTTPDNKSTPLV